MPGRPTGQLLYQFQQITDFFALRSPRPYWAMLPDDVVRGERSRGVGGAVEGALLQ